MCEARSRPLRGGSEAGLQPQQTQASPQLVSTSRAKRYCRVRAAQDKPLRVKIAQAFFPPHDDVRFRVRG